MDDFEFRIQNMKRAEHIAELRRMNELIEALKRQVIEGAERNKHLREELEVLRKNEDFWRAECRRRSAEMASMSDAIAEQRRELDKLRPKLVSTRKIE